MDKWFEKGYDEFNSGTYLTKLFLESSPYAIPQDEVSEPITNEKAEHLLRVFQGVQPTSNSVRDAIVACYTATGNGSLFGDYIRPARTIERCWELLKTNKLDSNPSLTSKMYSVIRVLGKLSPEQLSQRVPPTDLTKQQGSKDKVFLQGLLKDKGYEDCGGSFRKLMKAESGYLTSAFAKVLQKLEIPVDKSPDLVAKRHDTLYVGENKYQVESGGAQNLGIEDGISIFSVGNKPKHRLKMRRIFCFDGRLDLMLDRVNLITEENKIMSIFDVVNFIESGE